MSTSGSWAWEVDWRVSNNGHKIEEKLKLFQNIDNFKDYIFINHYFSSAWNIKSGNWYSMVSCGIIRKFIERMDTMCILKTIWRITTGNVKNHNIYYIYRYITLSHSIVFRKMWKSCQICSTKCHGSLGWSDHN